MLIDAPLPAPERHLPLTHSAQLRTAVRSRGSPQLRTVRTVRRALGVVTSVEPGILLLDAGRACRRRRRGPGGQGGGQLRAHPAQALRRRGRRRGRRREAQRWISGQLADFRGLSGRQVDQRSTSRSLWCCRRGDVTGDIHLASELGGCRSGRSRTPRMRKRTPRDVGCVVCSTERWVCYLVVTSPKSPATGEIRRGRAANHAPTVTATATSRTMKPVQSPA